MEQQQTIFEIVKDYLNIIFNCNIDNRITTRKAILTDARNRICHPTESTIDNYINYMRNAGYVEKVGRGQYKMLKSIPTDLSSTGLLKEAYPSKYD